MTRWSENNLFAFVGQFKQLEAAPSLSGTWLRGGSEVVLRLSVCRESKKREIDWSSDDVTSSWGWRQEDLNSRWDRALPARQSSLTALLSDSTQSIPDLRWRSFVTHRVSTFYYYLILHFYSKAKFQVAFYFKKK